MLAATAMAAATINNAASVLEDRVNVLAREALAPTAVGDGLAIPHVRNPVVLHIDRPSVAVCFLETPIPYGALDDRPVHTLLPIISPTTRAHLHLLPKLTFALRAPDVLRVLRDRDSRQAILDAFRRAESALAAGGLEARPAHASATSP